MGRVYSKQLIAYDDDGGSLEYTVPSGYTAVLRYASVFQVETDYAASLHFTRPGSGSNIFLWYPSGIASTEVVSWEGRVALPALTVVTVQLSTQGTSVGVYVGGYELSA